MHSARAVIVIYGRTRKEQQGVKEADDRTEEEGEIRMKFLKKF